MKVRKTFALASIAAVLIIGETTFPGSVANGQVANEQFDNGQMVNSHTPKTLQIMQELQNAETSDAAEEMRWTGRNDVLANHYAEKEGQEDELLMWLEMGKPVSEKDVEQTLKGDR